MGARIEGAGTATITIEGVDELHPTSHRTVGDRIRELVGAGFVLQDLIEPEWPEWLDREWGQWSPLRGSIFPGTAIFVSTLA